jgi:hypothetical protein
VPLPAPHSTHSAPIYNLPFITLKAAKYETSCRYGQKKTKQNPSKIEVPLPAPHSAYSTHIYNLPYITLKVAKYETLCLHG